MLFVSNKDETDPRRNLATEEYLLRHVELAEPILFFYINEPSVIIGRNQNSIEEIDADFVKANGIHTVRRLSGGGAVFHDFGNLNFSFVTNGRSDLHNFAKFVDPVVKSLNKLGVPAELRGKSDIFVDGKKVSGNAQFSTSKRMFSHGTLLFDTSLETMLKALNPKQVQIESRAVQSIRSFVANMREYLPESMTIQELRQQLLYDIFGRSDIPTYALGDVAKTRIDQIIEYRYGNWDWNIGRSPRSNIQKSEQFPVGKIDARINVQEGRIRQIKFYGTFFSQRDLIELESQLVGVPYEKEALSAALNELELTPYFGELKTADFLNLLY